MISFLQYSKSHPTQEKERKTYDEKSFTRCLCDIISKMKIEKMEDQSDNIIELQKDAKLFTIVSF